MGNLVPKSRFRDAFTRLGWIKSEARSGFFDVWKHPENNEIWTVIPLKGNPEEDRYYQEKNIKLIVYTLGLPENTLNINEVKNQLFGYNYKLISRIQNNEENQNESVPYELANILPNKSIDSFRSFYYNRTQGNSNIPIDKFEMNHTQHGSFIIPISIKAEIEDNETLFPIPSTTNVVLREYLLKVNVLTDIAESETDPVRFADKIMEANIDSKIVRDYLSRADSIAKYKEKYKDRIGEISISSKGSPILDYSLTPENKEFREVDLANINVLPEDFLPILEKREIEADDSAINEKNAKIEVSVDTISQDGTAKFVVYAINADRLRRPIKGTSIELPHVNLEFCVGVFKDKDLVIISGDITKGKGKAAKIVPSKFELKPASESLFSKK